jgi:hypothetical protein
MEIGAALLRPSFETLASLAPQDEAHDDADMIRISESML